MIASSVIIDSNVKKMVRGCSRGQYLFDSKTQVAFCKELYVSTLHFWSLKGNWFLQQGKTIKCQYHYVLLYGRIHECNSVNSASLHKDSILTGTTNTKIILLATFFFKLLSIQNA